MAIPTSCDTDQLPKLDPKLLFQDETHQKKFEISQLMKDELYEV